MSFIVYRKNKKTGTVYVFEAESYRDPVTKKPKSKRTYLGRLDEETQTIIPKSAEPGRRNRAKSSSIPEAAASSSSEAMSIIAQQRNEIECLKKEIEELNKKTQDLNRAVISARNILNKCVIG